jgi:hypothetical protein
LAAAPLATRVTAALQASIGETLYLENGVPR